MGQHHHRIPVSHIERNAEALTVAAEQLTRVAFEMKEAGMDDALFAWSEAQDKAIGLVTRLGRGCSEVLPEQILSKKTGVPSPIERDKQRSQRQIDERLAKRKAEGVVVKRGRPTKKKKAKT